MERKGGKEGETMEGGLWVCGSAGSMEKITKECDRMVEGLKVEDNQACVERMVGRKEGRGRENTHGKVMEWMDGKVK